MKKNLNVAPTEQELYNAGFKDSHFGLMEFNLNNDTTIVADTEKGIFRFIGSGTWLELTKQKINDAFALFNQPLPQWEKPKPHQYSYKGLKADGKIPHDRSGQDHDSIEAFKKLLAICEALNGMFEKDESDDVYCPHINFNILEFDIGDYQDESPIFFTSKEAFNAFKSAPENIELFKTFLKIK